jgi:polyphosphate glucokinase
MNILGIDIGGTGIKGAIVDSLTGELITERYRIETPENGKPSEIAKLVKEIVKHFEWNGAIGVGFPSVIHQGIAKTAANIHKNWVKTNVNTLLTEATGCPVLVVNDADAAGFAEMTFGVGKDQKGLVIMLTIGTGIGTALFMDGVLIPNMELGHIQLNGMDAEHYASNAARKKFDLSWEKWAARFNEYLLMMESLFWPNLFIIGGGVVKKQDKFLQIMKCRTPLVSAKFQNNAGIIGAAMFANQFFQQS